VSPVLHILANATLVFRCPLTGRDIEEVARFSTLDEAIDAWRAATAAAMLLANMGATA
jgi:hypothetical protein